MYLLPIYFCFFSFLLSILFGKQLSSKGSVFLNITLLLFSLIISIFICYEVFFLHINCYIDLFNWITVGYIDIYWSFLFDSLSSIMLIVILLVSFCANLYSVEYMLYEPHKIRFFSYLSLFTFTMIMLVTSNTLIQLFFGWECVGISSYLLINFWYTRIQANKSSILAVMANKIGDILLLFACLFMYYLYNTIYFNVIFLCFDNTLDYINNIYYNIINYNINGYFLLFKNDLYYIILKNNFFSINEYNNYNIFIFTSSFICFFIVFASICKSAQSGFHFWLAEAMEGPTPVSSLLHAATMVTAGIFLTIRCSFLFTSSSYIAIYIIFIGSVTSFFSSLIGLTQNDLKKIVAYSTCSQLGYMFLSNGIHSYNYTIFHLFNHAFFKALLFLTSGYIIHFLSNEQDLRKMGGLIKILPLPYIFLLLGSLSLMGLPYLSGFFSKDTIIENFYSFFISYDININNYYVVFFSQILLSISVIFTILYSVKLIFYVFINTYSGYILYVKNFHFAGICILIPLLILTILSITSGFFFKDYMIGLGSSYWTNSINMIFYNYDKLMPVFFSNKTIDFLFLILPYDFNKFTYYYIFILTIYFFIYGFILYYYNSFIIYYSNIGTFSYLNIIYVNINKKFLFFNRLIINSVLKIFFKESYQLTYKLIDKQIFEIIGPFGIIFNIKYYLKNINIFSTGLIYHYTGILILFIMISLFFIFNFSIKYLI